MRKKIFTKKNVQNALPFLDAGLALLSKVKPVTPYASALRVVTQVGQLVPSDEQVLLKKMKVVRARIKELEPEFKSHEVELVIQRTVLMAYLDLLLDQV